VNGLRDLLGLDGRWPANVFDLYLENHLLVDFALFASLFMAVTWAALRQRFPGRPGRVIAVCVGLTLSLSLTLTMASRNITLMDVAWFPALLLLLLAGAVVASLTKQSKVGVPTGGGIVIVVFGLILATTFDTRAWPINVGPIVSIVAIVLILRLIFFLGVHEMPGASLSRVKDAFSRTPVPRAQHAKSLSVGTDHAVKQNTWLRGQIDRARGLTAKRPKEPKERDGLAAGLEEAAKAEADLATRLSHVGELARRLEWADANAYAQLKKALRKGDAKARPLIARQMVFEWAKVEEEEKVYRLAHAAVREAGHVRHCLDKARDCIKGDRAERGERWLDVAGQRQEKLGGMLAELAGWERRLEEIARRQEAEGTGAPE
jgi:hypothetical protein